MDMKKKVLTGNRAGTLILIFLLLLTGCRQNSNKNPDFQKQSQEQEQSHEKPEQLKEIESSIEQIIKSLDGPAITLEKEKEGHEAQEGGMEEEQEQTQGQGKQGQSEGESKDSQGENEGSEGGSGQSGNEQQGQQEKSAQKPAEKDPWQQITPIINALHYKWNSFMPTAVKLGANKTLIDNFSNALNSLTNTIIGKNKTNVLLAASYLYAYIPDFYTLYRTSISPEIKRIRYYTRNAMLNAMTANWEQADSDINNLKSSWSLYKNTIPKDLQENASKLDFSIYELGNVITEKNQPLVDIKGRVAMSNIESLEKALEQSQQGGQGGSSGNSGNTSEGSESGSAGS